MHESIFALLNAARQIAQDSNVQNILDNAIREIHSHVAQNALPPNDYEIGLWRRCQGSALLAYCERTGASMDLASNLFEALQ